MTPHSPRTLLSCKRCGWEWFRRGTRRPRVCPSCSSPYWERNKMTPEQRAAAIREGIAAARNRRNPNR